MAARMTKRADGRYQYAIRYTDPVTGEKRRQYFTGKTQAEVRAKVKAAQERLDAGAPVRDSSRTLAEWSTQWRATSLEASDRRPTSKATCVSLLTNHVETETIGTVRLDRLGLADVERLIVDLRAKTTKRGARQLSESSISRVLQVLKVALDDAVAHGLIVKNPVSALKRKPKADGEEQRFLSLAEVAQLIRAAEGTRYHRPLQFIAATGLRKGELIGLRWSDFDLESDTPRFTVNRTISRLNGSLNVGPVKTGAGHRTLDLSAGLVGVLKAQRKAQVAERLRAGSAWTEGDYVFTTETGQPMDPRNVLRAVTTAGKKAGVADVDVHALRHSAATAMLDLGENLKTVSVMLGHSNIATTAKIYAHVSDHTARSAMASLSAAMGI
ncbi:tyrosine-type recombinase/integrase [Aeromicrobium fastidiosum]|uniref:Site-specific integrase n=1 Tax=Aeromicrobium fastidiosum TaxID=52699 RepID=A0A641AMT0_9ACTN|nr:site-specific integrase [Aeromicrobium fastidiosum]KAA1376112.1 site-specific integrase [Aeromicrobium fastidiosum]MBP2392008.1 integrase [Aeromicrobium fastidiosum]